jgi:hypothetical protein
VSLCFTTYRASFVRMYQSPTACQGACTYHTQGYYLKSAEVTSHNVPVNGPPEGVRMRDYPPACRSNLCRGEFTLFAWFQTSTIFPASYHTRHFR